VSWVDIGHDVQIEIRRHEGELHGVACRHSRPDNGAQCEGFASCKPVWEDGWDIVSLEPLTLSPSLLCLVCQHHGFIREGKWVPA